MPWCCSRKIYVCVCENYVDFKVFHIIRVVASVVSLLFSDALRVFFLCSSTRHECVDVCASEEKKIKLMKILPTTRSSDEPRGFVSSLRGAVTDYFIKYTQKVKESERHFSLASAMCFFLSFRVFSVCFSLSFYLFYVWKHFKTSFWMSLRKFFLL